MRNIETFPSKQMYPYFSLVERKVAEFYLNIDRMRWLVLVDLFSSLFPENSWCSCFCLAHDAWVLCVLCVCFLEKIFFWKPWQSSSLLPPPSLICNTPCNDGCENFKKKKLITKRKGTMCDLHNLSWIFLACREEDRVCPLPHSPIQWLCICLPIIIFTYSILSHIWLF